MQHATKRFQILIVFTRVRQVGKHAWIVSRKVEAA